MYKLIKSRSVLLQYGFVYDDQEKRYIQDLGKDSSAGRVFINDNEDFFRIRKFCTAPSKSCEHIAERNDSDCMMNIINNGIVVWERPPLDLSSGMKLFAINAGYRKTDIGNTWYYIRAKNAKAARSWFKNNIKWLDIYKVEEVIDKSVIRDVLSSPRKYICFVTKSTPS